MSDSAVERSSTLINQRILKRVRIWSCSFSRMVQNTARVICSATFFLYQSDLIQATSRGNKKAAQLRETENQAAYSACRSERRRSFWPNEEQNNRSDFVLTDQEKTAPITFRTPPCHDTRCTCCNCYETSHAMMRLLRCELVKSLSDAKSRSTAALFFCEPNPTLVFQLWAT